MVGKQGVFVAQLRSEDTTTSVRTGGKDEDEMFLAVGRALTTWELCEDQLIGLFLRISGDLQPIAAESYIHAPKATRKSMFELALKQNQRGLGPDRLPKELLDGVRKSLKRLEDLAARRNRIAHSRCTRVTSTVNGKLELDGFFLIPAFHKPASIERAFEFAFDPADIGKFTEETKNCLEALSKAYDFISEQRQKFLSQFPFEAGVILTWARQATGDIGQIETLLKGVSLSDWGANQANNWKGKGRGSQ